MRKHFPTIRIVIIALICLSGGLFIGKSWGYLKLAREVKVQISQYQEQREIIRLYTQSLEKEKAQLSQERDCLKKERDEAVCQRNIAVRTVDAIFRFNQATESSKQTKNRRTRPSPP